MKKTMKQLGCMALAYSLISQSVVMAAPVVDGGKTTQAMAETDKKEAGQTSAESPQKDSPYVITDEQELESIEAAGKNKTKTKRKASQKAKESDALPPQMGWSSWNCFHTSIDENKIREVAQAMVDSKLNEYGYVYLNMDDCWQSSMRDDDGRLLFDLTGFPSGPAFIKELNNIAGPDSAYPLKVGLYSSSGNYTCEDLPSSYGHEKLDAQTYAEWGIEFFKYDCCHTTSAVTAAPEPDYITVEKIGQPESVRYEAENAEIEGNASKQGWYVTGLNAGGGSVTFQNVNVPEDGTYVLTIGFRKTYSTGEKYAVIEVNDESSYETTFAPSNGYSNTGRQQLMIDLKAGTNKIKIHNPIKGLKEDIMRRYVKMGNALKEATAAYAAQTGQEEKEISFAACEHGRSQPWTWADDVADAHSWRISGDIQASWSSVVSKYEEDVKLWEFQKAGGYNDPDMLEVGNGLSQEENKSHFTLWCMLEAPLVLGNDLREFIKADGTIDHDACGGAYDIVTNRELIDLNQSAPMLQCKRVSSKDGMDILVKPLDDQEIAVCFFNKSGSVQSASYDLSEVRKDDSRVELPEASVYAAKDLWKENAGEVMVTDWLESGDVPSHGVKVFRIRAGREDEAEKLVGFRSNSLSYVNVGEEFTIDAEVKNVGRTAIENVAVDLTVPEGFTAVQQGAYDKNLAPGESVTIEWKVTAPKDPAAGTVRTDLSFNFAGESELQEQTLEKEISSMNIPANELVLSEMEWISAVSGWGSVRRNLSVDGNAITLQGQQYENGVGIHAAGDIKVYLGGKSYKFRATAGIDDEAIISYGNAGTGYAPPQVSFELIADGKKIYDSGNVGLSNSKVEINVLIENCRELILRVTDGGNGNSYDHADWANARFINPDREINHSITIEETKNGTITTNPANQVADGGSVVISFQPKEGYRLKQAFINGKAVEVTDGTYELAGVIDDLVIRAEFEPANIRNIALEATASSPAKTPDASKPGNANDNSLDVTKPGFDMNQGQDPSVLYLQYDWENGMDLDRFELMTTYGFRRGANKCEIQISYDGKQFEKLADWNDIEWKNDENVIESNFYELTEEEKAKAKNVKAMRLYIVETKYAWNATVIMEFRVMGSDYQGQTEEEPEEITMALLEVAYDVYSKLDTSICTKQSTEVLEAALVNAYKALNGQTAPGKDTRSILQDLLKAAAGLKMDTAELQEDINAAKLAASTAQSAADAAQAVANAAAKAKDLETLQGAVTAAQTAASAAQLVANQALSATQDNADAIEAVRSAASTAQTAAETAQTAAQTAQTLAEEAQNAANQAQITADQALKDAATNQEAANEAKEAADQALQEAQANKAEADAAKEAADQAQNMADQAMSLVRATEEQLQEALKQNAVDKENRVKLEEELKAAKAAANQAQQIVQQAESRIEAARKETKEAKAQAQSVQITMQRMAFKVSAVTLKTAKSAKAKQLKVGWKKLTGADGYEIRYASNAKFKKAQKLTVKNGTTLTKTIKQLASGKQCYVKVRAYRVLDGVKVYSKYSKVKHVKIK